MCSMTPPHLSPRDPYPSHPDSAKSTAPSSTSDPSRIALLSEFLALQPSQAMCRATAKESTACRVVDRVATRLNLTRHHDLDETPSEKDLVDSALAKCSQRLADGRDTLRSADDLRRRQQCILAMLYPTHQLLDPVLQTLSDIRRRISILRRAIRDQTQALAKLNDASNLLLLISDHVEIISSCYANSCTSSSTDWSCGDDGVKVRCLGRTEDSRSIIFISSVPANYRIRYLRKCWGFAADALSTAVELSSYFSRQLEWEGKSELVPGIDLHARPSMSFIELPGGLTFFFRSDLLQKMSNDAKEMREVIQAWLLRQRKFVGRLKRDLSKARKQSVTQEEKLADLRRTLLSQEFPDSYPPPF